MRFFSPEQHGGEKKPSYRFKYQPGEGSSLALALTVSLELSCHLACGQLRHHNEGERACRGDLPVWPGREQRRDCIAFSTSFCPESGPSSSDPDRPRAAAAASACLGRVVLGQSRTRPGQGHCC